MDKEFLNEIITGMIEQKRAIRLPNGRIGLLWKSPSEWAQLILHWVDSVGGRDGSVYTLYELIQGDNTQRQRKSVISRPSYCFFSLSFTTRKYLQVDGG